MIVGHAYVRSTLIKFKENWLQLAPDVKDICFYKKINPSTMIIIIIMSQETILLWTEIFLTSDACAGYQ